MPKTYESIASVTVASTTSVQLVMDNIPGTYTDLVLISQTGQASGANFMRIRYNASTSGYSYTSISGNGTTPTAARGTGESGIVVGNFDVSTNVQTVVIANVMNYSSSTIRKYTLVRAGKAATATGVITGLWSNTNAITRIDIDMPNIAVNSTFTLYGITGA
jgi:hypothetical protein